MKKCRVSLIYAFLCLDGFKIVTTETKFPGGESVVQTMEKEGIDNKTGKSFTLAKMLEAENDAAGKINNFSPGVIVSSI